MSELVIEQILPKGWTLTKLDDICELIGGGTPSRQNPEYFNGNILWLTPTEIPKNKIIKIKDSKEKITELGLKKSSAKIIPKNSVLLTSRASIGYVAIADTDVTTNQGFASFVCSNVIHNSFLAYWLFGKKNLLEAKATGTTFKEISKSTLKELEFKLPPLNEQKRIVEKIDQLFLELDHVTTIFVNIRLQLKQHRESLLKFAFEGKLPNLKHMDPSNWERVSYGDVCTKITYGFTNPMPDSNVGFWKITATNIKNGKINYENARKTDEKSFRQLLTDKSRPKIGTVLITKDGTLGEVAVVDRENICINQSVASLEPIQDKITPEYLALSLQKPSIKQYIEKFKRATTIAHISITDLAKWELYLPLQNEQKIIVNEIKYYQSLIAKMENVVNLTLSQLISLRSTILKQALEGKLVPQDPNDEPAEILLQKIKQEKEQLIQKQKISRSIKNVK